jgi:hypothetical protein
MTNADLIDPERASEILKVWVTVGRRAEGHWPVLSWQAVRPLIEANHNLLKLQLEEFRALVRQSDRRLHPLSDPFHLDFSQHRSFTGTREERYSDWLAWILDHLSNPRFCQEHSEWVFELLHLGDSTDLTHRCKGVRPAIKREAVLEPGRADLVIRYEASQVLLHIEVKVNPVTKAEWEGGNLEKNKWYVRDLREKFPTFAQHHVLLAIDADYDVYPVKLEDEPPVKFSVLKWRDVALGLRRIVTAGGLNKDVAPLLGALVLGFAGTIEQTLLRLCSLQSSCMNSAATQYLEQHLNGGLTMPNEHELEAARNELVKEGLASYLDALQAINSFSQAKRSFERAIIDRTEAALKGRKEELVEVLGIRETDLDLVDDCKTALENDVVIGKQIRLEPNMNMEFGLLFQPGDDTSPKVYAQVNVKSREAGEIVLKSFKEAAPEQCRVDEETKKYIWISDRITPDEGELFEDKLDRLLETWIKVWKKIGGIQKLPPKE